MKAAQIVKIGLEVWIVAWSWFLKCIRHLLWQWTGWCVEAINCWWWRKVEEFVWDTCGTTGTWTGPNSVCVPLLLHCIQVLLYDMHEAVPQAINFSYAGRVKCPILNQILEYLNPPLGSISPEKWPPCLNPLIPRRRAIHMCWPVTHHSTLNGSWNSVLRATVCANMSRIASHSFCTVNEVRCNDGRIVVAAGTTQPDDFAGETIDASEKHSGNSYSGFLHRWPGAMLWKKRYVHKKYHGIVLGDLAVFWLHVNLICSVIHYITLQNCSVTLVKLRKFCCVFPVVTSSGHKCQQWSNS